LSGPLDQKAQQKQYTRNEPSGVEGGDESHSTFLDHIRTYGIDNPTKSTAFSFLWFAFPTSLSATSSSAATTNHSDRYHQRAVAFI
jgi:hypothetical protein